MLTADDVIRVLKLAPHPLEGGFYRETYRSAVTLPGELLPEHQQSRSLSTAIYYLIRQGALSEMHWLPGDEIFHFHLGDPLEMLLLFPDGRIETPVLGANLLAGEQPQIVVPGGVWQGCRPIRHEHGFSLLGTTMAPGFDYHDYRRGNRAELTSRWPAAAETLALLTPNG
jgi:predicted cupin superfamily sugar epimerase